MFEITAIQAQVKDKERCNIYLDGQFYCGLKAETVYRYQLQVGQKIEQSRLEEIQFENEKMQALDKAFSYLSATMKTERQMLDYLCKKGYLPSVCDYVLEKLYYYKLLDDKLYTKQYIKSASKTKGARRIFLELRQKGVDVDMIDDALIMIEDAEERAKEMLAKYMRHKANTKENLAKAFRYLLSRGFNYDDVKSALANYGMEEEY